MLRFFRLLRYYLIMGITALVLTFTASAQSSSPATGDEFNPVFLIIAGVAVIGFVLVIVLTRPKKDKKDDEKDK
mgnify:CR=1 FL=1